MILKDRSYVVSITESEVKELELALEDRKVSLNQILEDGAGGVIARRHLETTEKLLEMVNYLADECNHCFPR